MQRGAPAGIGQYVLHRQGRAQVKRSPPRDFSTPGSKDISTPRDNMDSADMNHTYDDLNQQYEKLAARLTQCVEEMDKRSSLKTGIPLAESTRSRYRIVVQRLLVKISAHRNANPNLTPPEAVRQVFMEDATRQSSPSGRRAAMINKMGVAAKSCLRQAKAALDMMENAKAVELLDKGCWFITYLELAQQEYRLTAPAPRRSKSSSLRGLPPDWPELYLAEASKRRGAYWPRITALVLTGCRPAELLEGIKVQTIGTDAVQFIIPCAKIGAGRVRSITIVPGDRYYEAAKALAAEHQTIDLGGEHPSRKNRLSDKVRIIGYRALPRRKEGISPYSFRHAFASDLKAGGYSDMAIAQALGHANVRTKSRYGRYNQGRTGRSLILESEIPVTAAADSNKLPGNDDVTPIINDDGSAPDTDANDDTGYEP